MLDFAPNPIAIQLGPIPVYWYGIGYALGLAAAYFVMVWLARRAGEDPEILGNGIIVVAVAALIGGRLYHVIDQWVLYKDDPIRIFLPPYSGLGVYGGIVFGTVAAFLYARYRKVPFLRWADIVAPGLFTMQAIARWGNFFNQELYGPPTNLPWGIPIDCAHRVAAYACPPGSDPAATLGEHFHPLFLYESLSGALGAIALVWIGFHLRKRLRPGDLLLLFFVWYGIVRFALETFRVDNWTFFGVPVAQIVSTLVVIPALLILVWRHRRGHPIDDPPSRPKGATWGAIGRPVDPDAPDDEDGEDDDEYDDDEDDDYDDEDDGDEDDADGDEADDDEPTPATAGSTGDADHDAATVTTEPGTNAPEGSADPETDQARI
jgi:phosphatidylglycerol---prolipoprotein diacylglyceryl transferase